MVVGVVLPPGVDGGAGRVDQYRVVVVVVEDGVVLELCSHAGKLTTSGDAGVTKG